AQHPAEPVLLVRVQRRRHPAGGRRALSFVRIAAEPDGGGRGDGDELGRGDWQLAAVEEPQALAGLILSTLAVDVGRPTQFLPFAPCTTTGVGLSRPATAFIKRT